VHPGGAPTQINYVYMNESPASAIKEPTRFNARASGPAPYNPSHSSLQPLSLLPLIVPRTVCDSLQPQTKSLPHPSSPNADPTAQPDPTALVPQPIPVATEIVWGW